MLGKIEIEYPYSIKNLRSELSEVNHWCDLKYRTICLLTLYLETNDYTPTGIDKLFTDDSN
jgi:hypothetical protein